MFIVISAFGFGVLPIFALYAYQGGIELTTLLLIRFTLSSLLLFVFALWRYGSIHLEPGSLLPLLLLGFFYTLQSGFYLSAVRYIPASLAALILYSYPAFVCLLSFLFDRILLTSKILLSLCLSFLGVLLILGTNFRTIRALGLLLALGAAVVYSFYILISNRLLKRISPLHSSAFITLISSGFFLMFGAATGTIRFNFKPISWLAIGGIIVFSTLLAIVLFFRGLEILGSNRSSILSMTEPLFTVLCSTLLFGDRLTVTQLLGGASVLAGALIVSRLEAKTRAGLRASLRSGGGTHWPPRPCS